VALRLSTSNLDAIERSGVRVPHYDRRALAPRIVHLGVGGFHRAHMALYTDELAERGGDWAIRGIGLLDSDRRMASVLDAQDHLYTLIERDSNESRPRIVGSIVDYVLVAGDAADAALKKTPGSVLARITGAYQAWRRESSSSDYADEAGFCKSATLAEIKAADYALTPGRYVGAADVEPVTARTSAAAASRASPFTAAA